MNPLQEPAKIAFAGDWHMNWRWAVKAIDYCAKQGANVIVHAGDFGYDFTEKFISKVTRQLEFHRIPLIFVDGNHENFNILLNRYQIQENGLRKLTNYIWHAPRGFRWQWNNLTFLAMGGAHSVDRPWRILGESWWLEEHITDADILAGLKGGLADVLISHDCPTGVRIPGIGDGSYTPFPAEQIRQAEEHRTRLAEVVKGTRPAMIIHGHYHRYYETVTLFEHGHVKVIGLDCDESALEYNVRITDLRTEQEEEEMKQTVLGIADVGKLLGITADTVRRYLYESTGTGRRYSDHPLPAPDGRVGRSPYWNRDREDEIKTWAATRLGPGARSRSKL